MKRVMSLMGLCLTLTTGLLATDWPQFRGPNQTGEAPATDVFKAESFGFEVVWKRDLGSGYSGISVAGDIGVTMFSDAESDILTAFDIRTGKEHWRHVFGPVYKGHSGSQDGPTGSPTIHDGVVYAIDAHGGFVAVTLKEGKELWSHKLGDDVKARVPHYGFSTCPLVVDGKVIVMTGLKEEGRAFSAFDAKSGDLLWHGGEDSTTYQSPVLWEHDGVTSILGITDNHLMALDPKDGKVLWQAEHKILDNESYGLPVFSSATRVMVSDRRGTAMFDLSHAEGKVTMTEAWREPVFSRTYAIPVVHDGHLFGFKARFMTCVNPEDGKVAWRSRPPGGRAVSLVDGHILTISKEGDLVAIEATHEAYREKARMALFDQDSYTAVSYAGGLLFARNLKEMAAIAVTEKVIQAAATPADEVKPELMGKFGEWIKQLEQADDKKAMLDAFFKEHTQTPIVEGDIVHYVYRGETEDLALARGFEDERMMHRVAGTDFFFLSEKLDEASHWEYNFSIFGDAVLDPLNPHVLGEGPEAGNELRMPKWVVPDHLAETDGPKGRIEEIKIKSASLDEEVALNLYLPAGFEKGKDSYPLVVVTNDLALKTGRMDRSLDNLINGSMDPVIVAFMPPLSGPQIEARAAYVDFLVDELAPHLEKDYRAKAEPESRTIMGVGRGAIIGTYAVLKRPGSFGKLANQSFVFLRDMGDDIKEMLTNADLKGLQAYVEINRHDYDFPGIQAEPDCKELVELLKSKGAQVKAQEAAAHPGWGGWRGNTGTILEWFYPKGKDNTM